MKTAEEIIDDIIMKSPWGYRLWQERLKRKYLSKNNNSKTSDEPIQVHPQQTYFNFEEEYTNE